MDGYYKLASPAKVKGNFLTLHSSAKLYVSFLSVVLSKCTSGSSGLAENSGLKYGHIISMVAGGTGCEGTGDVG